MDSAHKKFTSDFTLDNSKMKSPFMRAKTCLGPSEDRNKFTNQ